MRDEEALLQKHIISHHLNVTKERSAILRSFMNLGSGRHVAAEELHQEVKRHYPRIGLATVYRTLHLFCACGLTERHHFGEGHTRYELTYNIRHHDHLICTECQQIIEFENRNIEKLQEQVARQNQFTIHSHKLELYGLCHTCATKKGGRAPGQQTGLVGPVKKQTPKPPRH